MVDVVLPMSWRSLSELVTRDTSALERLDKPVEYRLYKREGHVISRRENVLDFWERCLELLAEYLDLRIDDLGRVSPA